MGSAHNHHPVIRFCLVHFHPSAASDGNGEFRFFKAFARSLAATGVWSLVAKNSLLLLKQLIGLSAAVKDTRMLTHQDTRNGRLSQTHRPTQNKAPTGSFSLTELMRKSCWEFIVMMSLWESDWITWATRFRNWQQQKPDIHAKNDADKTDLKPICGFN